MSYRFRQNLNYETKIRPDVSKAKAFGTPGASYASCPTPIEWEPNVETTILHHFRDKDYPFRSYEIPVWEPLRTWLRRFSLALDAYVESSNPLIPVGLIIRLGATPSGIKLLKRIKTKSFIKSFGATLFEQPDWWESVPWYPIKDIGDIFNYHYCIHFVENNVEDYKEGFIDCKIDKEILEFFRKTLRDALSEIPEVEEVDYSEFEFRESASYSLTKDGKTAPSWTLDPSYRFGFAKSIGTTKRTVIQVKPEGPRDTVITTPKARNKIQLMDKQVALVLEEFKENAMQYSGDEIRHDLINLIKEFDLCICRDIKKEGITKPRILLKVMLEELQKRFPNFEAFKNPDFYEDFKIIVDNEILEPKRGHGLGMANSLTTLMQIVIFRMICQSEDSEGMSLQNARARAYNDDYIVFVDDDELEIYWDIEGDILGRLNIIREPTKSFKATRAGVLCEEYFDCTSENKISNKESYKRNELLQALCCVNIAHAKSLVSSISDNPFIGEYLPEIIRFWGSEFFENEKFLPTSCGGWIEPKILGVNISLPEIETYYGVNVYNAFMACKHKPHYVGKVKKSSYTPPIYFQLPGIEIPSDFKEYFNDVKFKRVLMKLYQRKTQPDLTDQIWVQLKKDRKSEFNKQKPAILFEDFISLVTNERDEDFLPLQWMVEKTIGCEGYKGKGFRDVYLGPNPNSDLIASFYELARRSIIPNQYTYLGIKDEVLNSSLFKHKAQGDEKTLALFRTGKILDENDDLMYVFNDSEESFKTYLRPYTLGTVWYLTTGKWEFPIMNEKFVKKKLLEEKEKIFGKIFSFSERLWIRDRCPRLRSEIKEIFNILKGVDISLFDIPSLQEKPEEKEHVETIIEEETTFPPTDDGYFAWDGMGRPHFEPGEIWTIFKYVEGHLAIAQYSGTLHLLQENRVPLRQNTSFSSYLEQSIFQKVLDRWQNADDDALEEGMFDMWET